MTADNLYTRIPHIDGNEIWENLADILCDTPPLSEETCCRLAERLNLVEDDRVREWSDEHVTSAAGVRVDEGGAS